MKPEGRAAHAPGVPIFSDASCRARTVPLGHVSLRRVVVPLGDITSPPAVPVWGMLR